MTTKTNLPTIKATIAEFCTRKGQARRRILQYQFGLPWPGSPKKSTEQKAAVLFLAAEKRTNIDKLLKKQRGTN